jgi:hypothetical protein
MAATTEEGTAMRRRKRLTIKLVAVGFAVAAMAPTTAQAWFDEGGTGGAQIVSPDDRPLHGMSYSSYAEPNVVVSPDDRALRIMSYSSSAEPNVVVSPDDRVVSRMSPSTNQPSLVSSDDGFELGTLGMTGIVLVLGAAAALIAAHETRRHRLAGA